MPGIADLEAVIARLEAATADARDATREAHEAARHARDMRRELEELLKRGADKVVEEAINAAVKRQLDHLIPDVQRALDGAVSATTGKFDEFAAILLGTEDDGRPTLEQSVRAKAAGRPLPHAPRRPRP